MGSTILIATVVTLDVSIQPGSSAGAPIHNSAAGARRVSLEQESHGSGQIQGSGDARAAAAGHLPIQQAPGGEVVQ